MARLRALAAPALVAALLFAAGAGVTSCASSRHAGVEQPARKGGKTHVVRRGENLFRIGQRYGVPAEVIQRANGIRDVTTLSVGQKIWIPPAGSASSRASLQRRVSAGVQGKNDLSFRWPVRGKLTSRYGSRRGGRHEGIDIAAPRGTNILAAEAGKVVFAGRMRDYGKMVVVKHAGNLRSVYAHVRRFHVRKGSFVESGQRIAEVGTTGNASGPHLHFEIRDRDRARDPMLYLR